MLLNMLRCLRYDIDYDIKTQKWHPINNDFFYGRFCFSVRDTTDSQLFLNNDFFSFFCLEGQFKKGNIRYSDLQFGFSFKKPFQDIPSGMTVDLMKSCAEMVWPEFKTFDIKSETPTLLSPIVLSSDVMHIGDNPNAFSIFHKEFTNDDFPTCRDKKTRRDYLKPRMNEMLFKKNQTYTFINHQNILDLTNKKVSFGKSLNMDLSKQIQQPIPLCLLVQGEFMINGQYLKNEEEAKDAIEFQEFQKAEGKSVHKYEENDLIILT